MLKLKVMGLRGFYKFFKKFAFSAARAGDFLQKDGGRLPGAVPPGRKQHRNKLVPGLKAFIPFVHIPLGGQIIKSMTIYQTKHLRKQIKC